MLPLDFSFCIQSDNLDNIAGITKYLSNYAQVSLYKKEGELYQENSLYFVDIIGLIDRTHKIPEKSDYFLVGSWENMEKYGKRYTYAYFQDYLLTPIDEHTILQKIKLYFMRREGQFYLMGQDHMRLLIGNLTNKLSTHREFLQEYMHLMGNRQAWEKMESSYGEKLVSIHEISTFHLLSINILQKSLELSTEPHDAQIDLEHYPVLLESYFLAIGKQLYLEVDLNFSLLTVKGVIRILQILYLLINYPKLNRKANYFLKYNFIAHNHDIIIFNRAMGSCFNIMPCNSIIFMDIVEKKVDDQGNIRAIIQLKKDYAI